METEKAVEVSCLGSEDLKRYELAGVEKFAEKLYNPVELTDQYNIRLASNFDGWEEVSYLDSESAQSKALNEWTPPGMNSGSLVIVRRDTKEVVGMVAWDRTFGGPIKASLVEVIDSDLAEAWECSDERAILLRILDNDGYQPLYYWFHPAFAFGQFALLDGWLYGIEGGALLEWFDELPEEAPEE